MIVRSIIQFWMLAEIKMLAEINVFGAFASPDDGVAQSMHSVVLVHWGVWGLRKSHVLEEGLDVYNLNSHLRGCIVFCLGCRLLHF